MNHLCKQSQWPEANRRNVQKPPRRRAIDTGAKFLMRRNIVGSLESRDRLPKRECFLKSFVRASNGRERNNRSRQLLECQFQSKCANQQSITNNDEKQFSNPQQKIRNAKNRRLTSINKRCTSYERFVSRFFFHSHPARKREIPRSQCRSAFGHSRRCEALNLPSFPLLNNSTLTQCFQELGFPTEFSLQVSLMERN